MKKSVKAIIVVCVVLALAGGMLFYLCSYTKADEAAVECMESTDAVSVVEQSDYIAFIPKGEYKTGLVYYQGGKVDVEAFAYAARRICEQGYFVALVRCSFNLAILDADAAQDVIFDHPEIVNWYVGGFSLGGVAACSFAKKNIDVVDGVLLFASYPNESISDSRLEVLSVSASSDGLCLPEDIEGSKANLPENTEFAVINGGNHTGFALYGGDDFIQKGDNRATISKLEQQDMMLELIIGFLNNKTAGAK